MCGRFALTATPAEVEHVFGVADCHPFPPRYNIAPTQPILMVEAGPVRPHGSNLPHRQAVLVRWGFIPSWAKNPRDLSLIINARAETAAEKPSFRAAMRHRRTLVPASGFYEWKRFSDGTSRAYWLRPTQCDLIAFGGLMETWSEPGGSEIDTGAILTTRASADIRPIHDRMPVLLPPDAYELWLDPEVEDITRIKHLFEPYPAGEMEAYAVSTDVNRPTHDAPDCIQPADHQRELF